MNIVLILKHESFKERIQNNKINIAPKYLKAWPKRSWFYPNPQFVLFEPVNKPIL